MRDEAVTARKPDGSVSKAFCSSADAVRREGLRFMVMGEPSGRFLGRPRSMIEASDSPRRCPMEWPVRCEVSDWPRVWPMGFVVETALGGPGLGEDRPSVVDVGWAELGLADSGVFEMDVGAVESASVEAELGVYGEARGYGDWSSMRALLGGTSGGVDPALSRLKDNCLVSLG